MAQYKIGIELALVGGLAQGLGLIANKLTGINKQVLDIEGGFRRWGAVLGATGIAGGVGIIMGLETIADHGEKLTDQQSKLFRSTKDWQGVVNLTAQAYDRITKSVPTATAVDFLRSVNELRSVVGSIEQAEAIAPMSLKMEALLKNLTGKDAEGAGFALWRSLEMKGITASNPELAQRLAFQMIQNIAGSGGKIDANTYQAMAKTGGTAWIHADPAAIAGPYSVAAADLGGDRAGTAIMTLSQLLSGATTISRQQYQTMLDAQIIDPSKVKKIAGSNAMNVQPGAIQGSLEHGGNLYDWTQSIMPKMEALANKLAIQEHADPKAVLESLWAKVGRNRNAARMLTMFSDPGFVEQIKKDEAIWSGTMGLDSAYATMLGQPRSGGYSGPHNRGRSDDAESDAQKHASYQATMGALQKQWESLLEAVGGPVARAAIPVLQSLTSAFNSMAEFSNRNPEAVANVTKAAAGLGAAMIVLGGAAVLGAAAALIPGGTVAVAIVGIGVAITTFAALNWKGISAALAGFFDGFQKIAQNAQEGLNSAVSKIAEAFKSAIASIPGQVAGAIAGMGSAIASAIAGAISRVGSLIPSFGGGGAATPAGPRDPRSPSTGPYRYERHSLNGLTPAPRYASAGGDTVIHLHNYMDGREVATIVSRHQLAMNDHPRQAPYFDTHGGFAAPDFSFVG